MAITVCDAKSDKNHVPSSAGHWLFSPWHPACPSYLWSLLLGCSFHQSSPAVAWSSWWGIAPSPPDALAEHLPRSGQDRKSREIHNTRITNRLRLWYNPVVTQHIQYSYSGSQTLNHIIMADHLRSVRIVWLTGSCTEKQKHFGKKEKERKKISQSGGQCVITQYKNSRLSTHLHVDIWK